MSLRRLTPRRVEKPWGRHDLGAGVGALPPGAPPVGEIWFEDESEPGRALLVKYLFTSERLSIQVHPDDAAARAEGQPGGKDEAWIVLAADPGATIGLGLTRAVGAEELRAAALDGSIERLVDWRPVATGDVFYSPAGTIHAIGPGLVLVEIQQNIDLTYRLYDYGRPRELHLDAALAVARAEPFSGGCTPAEIGPGRSLLCEGPAFRLERWSGGGARLCAAAPDRPAWIVPLAGGAQGEGEALAPGGVWLAEGDANLVLAPGADLLVARPGREPM